jgi:hypothetical protein
LDGKSGVEHDFIDHIYFSPDGKRLAYEAGIFEPDKDDHWFMVVDGKARPEMGTLVHGQFLFSADSQHEAYLVGIGDRCQAVIDGQVGPAYKLICQLHAAGADGFESIVVEDSLYRMGWEP